MERGDERPNFAKCSHDIGRPLDCWLVSTVEAQSPQQRDFNPRVLMKHLRPIVDAPFIPATKVRDQVADNELVLGVVVAGQPRAYPINMLTGPSREIINDQLGGHAIAATW